MLAWLTSPKLGHLLQDLSTAVLGIRSHVKDTAHMQGMGATAAWTDGSEWCALRDREHTYAIYRKDQRELLFNNRRDQYQLINLAEDRSFQSTVKHYRSVSEMWRKQQNDTFEACSWYELWTNDRNIINTAKGVTQDLDALSSHVTKWFPDTIGEQPVGPWTVGT